MSITKTMLVFMGIVALLLNCPSCQAKNSNNSKYNEDSSITDYETDNEYDESYLTLTAEKISLTIPDGTTHINAWEYQVPVISVTIPDSVISIDIEAFSDTLKQIVISGNVELKTSRIHSEFNYAMEGFTFSEDFVSFYNSNGKKAGTYDYINEKWKIKNISAYKTENNFIIDAEGSIIAYEGHETSMVIPAVIDGVPVRAIASNTFRGKNISTVVIPESISSIGYFAFFDNKLTSVIIPSSVTTIGAGAFASNQITSVIFSEGISFIDDYAFYDNQITSVTIPASVKYIGNSSFQYNRLTSVTIPGYISTIGENAFSNNRLTSVVIENGITLISDGMFAYNLITETTIPFSVTSIGKAAFYKNPLKNIKIPNEVAFIGNEAFKDNRLHSITLPATVTHIGESAFYGNRLTTVDIPDGVTSVGSYAFMNNLPMESVTIPDSITSIGNCIFANSDPRIIIIGADIELDEGTIGDHLITFSDFYQANGKKAGFYVQNRGSYAVENPWRHWTKAHEESAIDGFFTDGNGTIIVYTGQETNIVIPDKIEDTKIVAISDFVFCGKGLTSVTLPSSVTSIGDWAFAENELTTITIGTSGLLEFSNTSLGVDFFDFYVKKYSGWGGGTFVYVNGKWRKK